VKAQLIYIEKLIGFYSYDPEKWWGPDRRMLALLLLMLFLCHWWLVVNLMLVARICWFRTDFLPMCWL